MSRGIGLIGSGGHADEVESYTHKNIDFRATDECYLNERATVNVSSPGNRLHTSVHIAIGAPVIRKELEEKWPGDNYETIISEYAIVDSSSSVGEGSLVAPRAVITTGVKIGRHVIINVASSVQHNTVVGDFVTISPGVHIGGNVVIGDGVFVGIGACISNGVRISDGVIIGAGATVVHDAGVENGVYVGAPASLIKRNNEWMREV